MDLMFFGQSLTLVFHVCAMQAAFQFLELSGIGPGLNVLVTYCWLYSSSQALLLLLPKLLFLSFVPQFQTDLLQFQTDLLMEAFSIPYTKLF